MPDDDVKIYKKSPMQLDGQAEQFLALRDSGRLALAEEAGRKLALAVAERAAAMGERSAGYLLYLAGDELCKVKDPQLMEAAEATLSRELESLSPDSIQEIKRMGDLTMYIHGCRGGSKAGEIYSAISGKAANEDELRRHFSAIIWGL